MRGDARSKSKPRLRRTPAAATGPQRFADTTVVSFKNIINFKNIIDFIDRGAGSRPAGMGDDARQQRGVVCVCACVRVRACVRLCVRACACARACGWGAAAY